MATSSRSKSASSRARGGSKSSSAARKPAAPKPSRAGTTAAKPAAKSPAKAAGAARTRPAAKKPVAKAAVSKLPVRRKAAPATTAAKAPAARKPAPPAAERPPADPAPVPAAPPARAAAPGQEAAPKPAPVAHAPAAAPPPAAQEGAAPPAPARPKPSIVIAPPTDTPTRPAGGPMSSRPPIGRPAGPPAFAVRGPGRPGFGEGQAPMPRPAAGKADFKPGDHVVYPTHGVGTVQGIETVEAAGMAMQVVVVTFEENRMTLRVPLAKVASAGLRKLLTPKEFEAAIETLKGRARIKRTMWSRRAQEYEAKINSGDPIQIAEVVRDLQRNAGQPDQSFSERQIYELALDRLAAEYAAIEKIDKAEASARLVAFAKSS